MTTSVLICTYNRGELISDTLESIIYGQTKKPDEIIIVNGGGAQNCKEVLNHWKNEFENFKIIETQNINLATSRNLGLSNCSGDIILQTDDDAILFPDWLEQMIIEHKKHPKVGVIGGDVVDSSGKKLLFKIADAITFPHHKKECEVRTVPGVNSSYKKEVIKEVGTYDTTLFRGEDVDYNWRCILSGWTVMYYPNIKVYHKHRSTWKGLFNQHYMYGKAYFLVRKKWKNMYCHYPRKLNNIKSYFKLLYFMIEPFVDSLNKLKHIKGLNNKILAYLIIVSIQYYWRLGLLSQMLAKKT